MPPTASFNEERRLEVLRDYDILDTQVEQAYTDLINCAAYICNAPIAVINFIDADRQWFKAERGLGIRETPLDISICRHALFEEDIMIIEDTRTDARTRVNPLVSGDNKALRFYAGALIKSNNGFPLGTLCVLDYQPRTLTDEQVELLKALRRQTMLLLEYRRIHKAQNKLLNELNHARGEMQRLAHEDPLTGLLNRRAFEAKLALVSPLNHKQARGMLLMLIDLDNFKQINDSYGHQVGDIVLNHAAGIMKQVLRTEDTLCRWGGDEFIALLEAGSGEQAVKIGHRLRDALSKSPLPHADQTLRVSASVGLAWFHPQRSLDDNIAQTDKALYHAKRDGIGVTLFST